MKIFFLVFIFQFSLVGISFSKDHDDNLEKIKQTLLKHKEVSGKFKQVRFLEELNLKLESEGSFQIKLPFDLVWNQKKPFIQDLIMSPYKIIQKNTTGDESVMTKAQQPAFFAFSSSFMSVFNGDRQIIEKNFDSTATFKKGFWSMSLSPKDDLLKKAIANIVVKGNEFVQTVEVYEKLGNSTVITFSQIKGK